MICIFLDILDFNNQQKSTCFRSQILFAEWSCALEKDDLIKKSVDFGFRDRKKILALRLPIKFEQQFFSNTSFFLTRKRTSENDRKSQLELDN